MPRDKEKAKKWRKDWIEKNKERLLPLWAAYRQENRARILATKKRCYYASREKTLATQRTWRDTHPKESWMRAVRKSAQLRAKSRGLPWDENLLIQTPDVCPVLGVVMDYGRKGTGKVQPNSPSLDRLIPHLGYVNGNVVTISHRANSIKNAGSAAEHEAIAIFMRAHGCL